MSAEPQVVVTIPFESMSALHDRFMAVFPENRDALWRHIPEIRRQIEALDMYCEEEKPPPGYITLPPRIMGALGEVMDEMNGMGFNTEVHDAAKDMQDAEVNGKRLVNPNTVHVTGTVVSLVPEESGVAASILLHDWCVEPEERPDRYRYSVMGDTRWLRVYVEPQQAPQLMDGLTAGRQVRLECGIETRYQALAAMDESIVEPVAG